MEKNTPHEIIFVSARQQELLLKGKERELIDLIMHAYLTHAKGDSVLPHSVFLKYKQWPNNRIIALPCYLGGQFNMSGIKWISSSPGNWELGIPRASGIIILNDVVTGRPISILDASRINAKRTAASAALAAQYLVKSKTINSIGLIGCGVINLEIARFLAFCFNVNRIVLMDINPRSGESFIPGLREIYGDIDISVAHSCDELIDACDLISIATTAKEPHIEELPAGYPEKIVLNISLRDLSVETILSGVNIVDDVDHVCRESTSLHLTEKVTGNRGFIKCPIADLVSKKEIIESSGRPLIFSPFGLGVLDVAVAQYVSGQALEKNMCSRIEL